MIIANNLISPKNTFGVDVRREEYVKTIERKAFEKRKE